MKVVSVGSANRPSGARVARLLKAGYMDWPVMEMPTAPANEKSNKADRSMSMIQTKLDTKNNNSK